MGLVQILWSCRSWIAIGLIVVAIGSYVTALKIQIRSRDADIVRITEEKKALGTSLQIATDQSAQMEKSLLAIKEQGDRMKVAAIQARKQFDDLLLTHLTDLDSIVKWKPAINESDCDATRRILREQFK